MTSDSAQSENMSSALQEEYDPVRQRPSPCQVELANMRKESSFSLSEPLDPMEKSDAFELESGVHPRKLTSEESSDFVEEKPFGWMIVFAVFFIHVIVDGVSAAFASLVHHRVFRHFDHQYYLLAFRWMHSRSDIGERSGT